MGMLMKTADLAGRLRESIRIETDAWKKRGIEPSLAVVLLKGDPASEYYARAKEKTAQKLGIGYRLMEFDPAITQSELLGHLGELNEDKSVHGIMLELPLPRHLNPSEAFELIRSDKDVDGITPGSKLACYLGTEGLYPATPQSCIRILQEFGFGLKGRHVVLVGRGETVGRPLMPMLLREHATLTVCHSHTENLARHIAGADILITAAGRAGMVTADMVHPDLVVVDAGINETDTGLTGDVSPDALQRVKAMTPVPGGVGTLTTLILFENLLKAVGMQIGEGAHK
ncbi:MULTISPECIES: bifunctional 5,10-methylenetetrahydrofolate dehydrogenase/5,10-methenyltetrahydrofolate cyclohydrolase [unclassified Paenibacillus]|uniref:bifunctional 5,10-methylenetetrahydrofolate dehydrogenase/5,10-methenyltetrahydrofolate cyclohydrolase n=1 Tax=unclassified Paenibacillus TaxID=185978 RepID=UPI00020D76C9|nr:MULTISPECIES: bifunctional 5,10-methylenetetrahydrofolate dehydrogenase/5,10-methenyltetrahydrofolate cyclohydrolase [unclassified Paenibacillus]EGL19267.1 tetrahydrofolate dehydrogenase/cyclohydrolase, NAD(P)-binding domain protein [Paenibacillus sp. HGF7]EPD92630.1 hypothetical protein HMPREF1207_00401 [Paenibacillus sp. HGH0039]